MVIVTVPGIELNEGKLQVLTKDGTWIDLHYQQGEIGGCCAVYSVAFCMMYEQMVNGVDVKGRTNGDRLLRELFDKYGIVRSGFDFKDLKTIMDKYKKKSWKVDLNSGTPKRCVDGICDQILNMIAPIIGIDYTGCRQGHALLAVGYEEDQESGKPLKIFCLDPGAPTPKTSIWNSYIDVRDLRKPSIHVNDDPEMIPSQCRLTEYIVLHNTDRDESYDNYDYYDEW